MERKLFFIIALLLFAFIAACDDNGADNTDDSSLIRRAEYFSADAADSARVCLEMYSGEIEINASDTGFVNAQFRYNVPEWEPEISYTTANGLANLLISQPDSLPQINEDDRIYEWNLGLGPQAPVELELAIETGVFNMGLDGMKLEGLSLALESGVAKLDYSGYSYNNMISYLALMAGTMTIIVPKDFGARLQIDFGTGGPFIR